MGWQPETQPKGKPPVEKTKGEKMNRLIDADAVEKVLEEKHFRRVLDSDRWLIADIRKSIMDLPTIDAEPVKHGKWIDETFEPWGLVHHPYKCNLCGEHAEFASPYCPNCGCRMDEE